MAHLFTYGTLMDLDIFRAVTGLLATTWTPARLDGYARFRVSGTAYPGILAWPDEQVSGRVFFSLPQPIWPILDRYEGPLYAKILVAVTILENTPLTAWTYSIHPSNAAYLSHDPWSLERFQNKDKPDYLAALS